MRMLSEVKGVEGRGAAQLSRCKVAEVSPCLCGEGAGCWRVVRVCLTLHGMADALDIGVLAWPPLPI